MIRIRPLWMDVALVALAVAGFFGLSVSLELSERVASLTGGYESWQLDELPLTLLVLALGLAWFVARRMRELRAALAAQARAEAASTALLQQNQALAQQLIGAQEEERRSIARELHDELGQYFSAIKVDAISIERALDPGDSAAKESARAIAAAAGHMHEIARGMLGRLRPSGLDELGLVPCLQELAETWETRHGIECVFLPTGELDTQGEAVNITVYRMVQECLNNVARHARAQRATVRMACEAGILKVSVQDDGIGSEQGALPAHGLGLLGMHERVAALGGALTIEAGSSGTRVAALLPLAKACALP